MTALDFCENSRLRSAMDDSRAQLVRLLYNEVGTVMEDACVTALKLGGSTGKLDPARFAKLQRAANTIAALMKAASALNE